MKQILTLLFAITVIQASAQVHVYGSFTGIYNTSPATELAVGYRWRSVRGFENTVTSVTYNAPLKNDMPLVVTLRQGFVINESFHLFAGPSAVLYNNDDKRRNFYTFSAGGQYHFENWNKGSFYISPSYIYRQGFTLAVGMSLNLVKEKY